MEAKLMDVDQHVISAVAGLVLSNLLVLGILAGVAVSASASERREATALNGATITLSQAVAAAEQHTGGKAFDAGINTKGTQPSITVETNGPKGVQTIHVDARNGQVVGAYSRDGAS